MARRLAFAGPILGLLLGLLAGCGIATGPAPIELHTHPGASSQTQPVPHPDRIVVASTDTLYALSRRYGVPMRAVIDANALQPPYRLRTGSALVLPQVRTHEVRPGDTLVTVARNYGVEASTLASTNHLEPPYVVRNGETLILPAPVESAGLAAPPATPRQDMAVASLPPQPAITATSLPPPPAAPAPLAPPAVKPVAEAPPHPEAAPSALPANDDRLRPSAPVAAKAEIPPPPAPEAAKAPPPEQSAALPPPAPPQPAGPGKGFIWPVQGKIVATYGTGPGGTHNDGINIAAPEGTPVLAAAAGEVAYAGNELRGYGNLILIKHDDGFITAYGHNQTLLVKRGERVTRGQPIAKVGATGAVSEPQLHFEIRRGARVLDPGDYLPEAAATARS